jgi:hypothetical protein
MVDLDCVSLDEEFTGCLSNRLVERPIQVWVAVVM